MNLLSIFANQILSYFRFKSKAISLDKDQYSLLLESEHFDGTYYSEQCGERFTKKREALKHYLDIGSKLGLNPSYSFNIHWYMQNNPDVAESGINPFLHYVFYGEDEGRSACPDNHSTMGFTSPDICNEKLWGGFSNFALPKLEALKVSQIKCHRVQSLWHLARWHYVYYEPGRAIDEISLLEKQQKCLSQRLVVGKSKCFFALGEMDRYAEFVDRLDVQSAAGDELPYMQANKDLLFHQDEASWLSNVNTLFVTAGLCGIKKLNIENPLSLDNLAPIFPEKPHKLSESFPKVSVIVPAFNAAKTIHIALNSLVSQTWPNLEIVVVDDASKDETGRVVQNFCHRFGNIKYLRNAENIGAYPTRNLGYQNTSGDFVTVHDSDDWSHPQKIEKQIETLLKDTSKVISYTNWVRVNGDLGFVGPWLLCENFLEKNHSSAMIRRDVIEKSGAWDSVNVGADTEFLWRIEKIYGAESIAGVLPKVPFSFALALSGSLTQAKVTHVETVYYGLRRLYREAAAWWHTTEPDNLCLDPLQRKFPFPLGNSRCAQTELDMLVAGDFSCSNTKLKELLEQVRNLAGTRSLVLFHWPDYRQLSIEPVSSEAFALCMELGFTFTHAQYQISARKVYLFDSGLLEWEPNSLPLVKGMEEIQVLGGQISVPEEQRLRELFSAASIFG